MQLKQSLTRTIASTIFFMFVHKVDFFQLQWNMTLGWESISGGIQLAPCSPHRSNPKWLQHYISKDQIFRACTTGPAGLACLAASLSFQDHVAHVEKHREVRPIQRITYNSFVVPARYVFLNEGLMEYVSLIQV